MRLNESVGIDGLSKFQQNLMYKDADKYAIMFFLTKDGETSVYQIASNGDGVHVWLKNTGHDRKALTPSEIRQSREVYHISQLDGLSWMPSDLVDDLKAFVMATDDHNKMERHYDYQLN